MYAGVVRWVDLLVSGYMDIWTDGAIKNAGLSLFDSNVYIILMSINCSYIDINI